MRPQLLPAEPGEPIALVVVARCAGALAAGLGLLVMVAWEAHWTSLLTASSPTPMRFNTGLGVALAGIAVILATLPAAWALIGLRGVAAFEMLLGAATITEHVFGWDLHIDQLLFHDYLGGGVGPPGRLALNTAVSFLALGTGLLLWRRDSVRRSWALFGASAFVLVVALFALIGYLAGMPRAGNWSNIAMAVPTALSFTILVTGAVSVSLTGVTPERRHANEWVAIPGGVVAVAVAALIWQSLVRAESDTEHVPVATASRAALVLALVAGTALAITGWLAQRANRRRHQAITLALELQLEVESRIAAQAAARQKERLLFQILNALPVGIVIIDLERRPYFVNDTARQMLPRGADQIAAPSYPTVMLDQFVAGTGQPYPRERAPLLRALAGEATHVDDVEIRTATGPTFFEVWGTPLNDEGRPFLAMGTLMDITSRRAAERDIVEKATMLDLSHDAIFMLDGDRCITYWNHGAESLYGYAADEVLGRRSVEVLATEVPVSTEAIDQALDEVGFWDGEIVNHRRDGSPVEVLSHWVSRRDEAGGVSTLEINTDITALKVAERKLQERAVQLETLNLELRRSNDDLAQFAYAASHDLAEPLRAISGPVSVLARRYRGRLDPQADEFIEFAVDGCERMQTLINDLLAFSRVGRINTGWQAVDLNQVVQMVRGDLRAAITERDAAITVDPLPVVDGTRSELRQVLQNLIGNAIKFTPPARAPTVHVGAERSGRLWRFEVTDNGIGIEPRHRDRIFGMFKRLHGREEYPGTGIGLALAKKIVERHGGEIGVADGPGGVGCTFWFTLPARKEDAP